MNVTAATQKSASTGTRQSCSRPPNSSLSDHSRLRANRDGVRLSRPACSGTAVAVVRGIRTNMPWRWILPKLTAYGLVLAGVLDLRSAILDVRAADRVPASSAACSAWGRARRVPTSCRRAPEHFPSTECLQVSGGLREGSQHSDDAYLKYRPRALSSTASVHRPLPARAPSSPTSFGCSARPHAEEHPRLELIRSDSARPQLKHRPNGWRQDVTRSVFRRPLNV